MKTIAFSAVDFVWKAAWFVIIMPFMIPAFLIAKLLGADPLSLDGMGIGFLVTALIAAGLAIGAGFFFLGTLI